MKLRLYDDKELELPFLKSFNQRVKYIEDKMLMKDKSDNENFIYLYFLIENGLANKKQIIEFNNIIKYQKYYNICAVDLPISEIRNIENWWLGVRKVNNPLPIENIKMILNYITGYLLGAKDYSTKPLIQRYTELKKKRKNDILKQEEKQEFYNLKENIIYEDKDFIFMDNPDMENQLRNSYIRLHNIKFKNRSDKNTMKNIIKRLTNCKECKKLTLENKEKIDILIKDNKEISSSIKKEYGNKDNLDNVLSMANKIKKNNNEINYLRHNIELLNDKYLIATEFIYKTK